MNIPSFLDHKRNKAIDMQSVTVARRYADQNSWCHSIKVTGMELKEAMLVNLGESDEVARATEEWEN